MHKRMRGFTLVELLAVTAIISLLTTNIFANVSQIRAQARDAYRVLTMSQIMSALEFYRVRHGHYPITNEVSTSSNFLQVLVDEGYLSDNPQDPINQDNFIFYYSTLHKIDAGGVAYAPGSYVHLTFDAETPNATCPNGIFVPAFPGHCHMIIPPLPCDDPYITQVLSPWLTPNCQSVAYWD